MLCLKSWLAGPSSSSHLLFSLLALVPQDVVISRRHGSGYRELDKADVGGDCREVRSWRLEGNEDVVAGLLLLIRALLSFRAAGGDENVRMSWNRLLFKKCQMSNCHL